MATLQWALDRIEQLEELLGVDRETTWRIREAFNLEPLWAQMLGHFYSRTMATRDGLYIVLYEGRPESDWPEEKIMDVQLCKLRRYLRKTGHADLADAIVTKWGEGWTMTPAGKAIIREALKGDGLPMVAAPSIAPTDFPTILFKGGPA